MYAARQQEQQLLEQRRQQEQQRPLTTREALRALGYLDDQINQALKRSSSLNGCEVRDYIVLLCCLHQC